MEKMFGFAVLTAFAIPAFAAQNVVVVDDLKPGLEMAHACGVDFAACFWSYDIPVIRSFMRDHADYCLNSVDELGDLLFSGEEA